LNLKSIIAAVVTTGPLVLERALEVADVIAPMVPGGAAVETAVKMAITIGTGLVKAEPAAEALWAEIQAVKNGGAEPTAEQWNAWEERVNSAHDDLNRALALG
jgi:hypothetical protein